jgi:hypothetical protein
MGNNHRQANRRGAAIAALIGSAIALAACAPGALATKGLTRTKSTTLPPESQRSVSATCPRGTHSTSGGFRVSPGGVPGQGFQALVQNSDRSGNRGWSVTGGAESTNPSSTLTAVVRCERKSDGKVVVPLVGSQSVNPGFAQTFNFHCPPGTRPVGAGWSVDNPYTGDVANSSNLIVVESRRTNATTWTLTAEVRSASTVVSTFTGTVPCERKSPRKLVQKSRTVSFSDNQRASASATCAKRTHVVSGGFVINPLPPGVVPFAPVDYNAASGPRSWRVDLYDTVLALPPGSTLTTYAYCRRNKGKRKRKHRHSAHRAGPRSAAAGSGWVKTPPPVPVG